MIEAAFYVISFIFSVIMLCRYPKRKDMYLITNIMFSYVTVLCLTGLAALLLTVAGIPVRQYSMGIVMVLTGIMAWIMTLRVQKKQHCLIERRNVISVIGLIALVGIVSLIIFTPYVYINYSNLNDSAVHYSMAQNIVESQKVSSMFINPLYNAMFMKIMTWALPVKYTYKAFILSDVYHQCIELVFFYSFIIEYFGRKKYMPLLISVLYWIGYPLMGFYRAYIYWNMGAMFFMYILLLLKWYTEAEDKNVKKKYILPIVVGLFGLTFCYIQFAPIAFILTIIIFLRNKISIENLKTNRKIMVGLVIMLAFCICCALLGVRLIWGGNITGIFKDLKLAGTFPANELELLIIVPTLVYVIIKKKKERPSVVDAALICTVVVQGIFLIMKATNNMSLYYYCKTYNILWLLIFLNISSLWDRIVIQLKQKWKYSLVIGAALLFTSQQGEDAAFTIDNSIYVYNISSCITSKFRSDYVGQAEEINLYEKAANLYEQADVIPLLKKNVHSKWYIVLYPYECEKWLTNNIDSNEAIEYLDGIGAEYFMTLKSDDIYRTYLDRFNDDTVIFENDYGIIAKRECLDDVIQ